MLKLSMTIKRLKEWSLYLIRQEFHNNQEDNNNGEQVDETGRV